MPQIRPYTQQLTPDASIPAQQAQASDFGGPGVAMLGKSIQGVGQDMAYVEHFRQQAAAQQDVANAQVVTSELHTSLLQDLLDREANWKAGDPPVADAYREHVKQQFEEQGQQFETAAGQQHYATRAAAISSQLVIESARVQSQLHGQAVANQVTAWSDKEGNFLVQNPTYAPMKIEDAAKTVGSIGSAYSLKQGQIEKLARSVQEKLAVNGVQGLINRFPNRALEVLQNPELAKDGQYGWIATYLPQEKRDAMIASAQTAVNGIEADARKQTAEQARMRRELSDTLDSQLAEQDILSRDASTKTPPVRFKDVLAASNAGLDSDKVKGWIAKIDERANRLAPGGEVKTNVAVKLNLFERIGLPPGDPRKITDSAPIREAYLKKQLSDSDHDWLTRQALDAKSPDGDKLAQDFKDFYKRVPEQVILQPGPFGVYKSATNGLWLDKYVQDVELKKMQYKKSGKDPRDLINPQSPDYVGSREFLTPYIPTGMDQWPAASVPVQPPPNRKSLDDIFGKKP